MVETLHLVLLNFKSQNLGFEIPFMWHIGFMKIQGVDCSHPLLVILLPLLIKCRLFDACYGKNFLKAFRVDLKGLVLANQYYPIVVSEN